MSVKSLRLYCQEKGIKVLSGAKKVDIVNAVLRFRSHTQAAPASPERTRRAHKGRHNPITPSSKLKLSERRTQAMNLARLALDADSGTSAESAPRSVTSGHIVYNWVSICFYYWNGEIGPTFPSGDESGMSFNTLGHPAVES
jgi:hypothetical protein